MVAWPVLSLDGGKKEKWGPHRHPPSIEKVFMLHHIKGDLGAAGDMESASQAGDDLERAGVLERRGQEEGAAERMQMGGGGGEPGHLHLSACLLARRLGHRHRRVAVGGWGQGVLEPQGSPEMRFLMVFPEDVALHCAPPFSSLRDTHLTQPLLFKAR